MTDAAVPAPRSRANDEHDLGPVSATPALMVERFLDFADVSSSDLVFDLGCGDGRVCVAASELRRARSVGAEIDPKALASARANVERANTKIGSALAEIRATSAFDVDASEATVVFSYLLPKGNARLGEKLLRECAPGTRVVTYVFKMPDEEWGERLVKSEAFSSTRERKSGGVDASAYNKLYLYVV